MGCHGIRLLLLIWIVLETVHTDVRVYGAHHTGRHILRNGRIRRPSAVEPPISIGKAADVLGPPVDDTSWDPVSRTPSITGSEVGLENEEETDEDTDTATLDLDVEGDEKIESDLDELDNEVDLLDDDTLPPDVTRTWTQHSVRLHSSTVFSQSSTHHHYIALKGSIVRTAEFYARVKVGKQYFNVQIDTGSSLLAIPDALCRTCVVAVGDSLYDTELSPSFQDFNCTSSLCAASSPDHKSVCSTTPGMENTCAFTNRYQDSEISGALGYDVVQLGDAVSNKPVVFGRIGTSKGTFSGGAVDGILGVAPDVLSIGATTLFDQLLQSQGSAHKIFSMCLTEKGGSLDLGPPVRAKYHGHLQWTPSISTRYYAIDLHAVEFKSRVGLIRSTLHFMRKGLDFIRGQTHVGQSSLHRIPVPPGMPVILDSGSTFLTFPSALGRDLWDTLSDQPYHELFLFDSSNAGLPCIHEETGFSHAHVQRYPELVFTLPRVTNEERLQKLAVTPEEQSAHETEPPKPGMSLWRRFDQALHSSTRAWSAHSHDATHPGYVNHTFTLALKPTQYFIKVGNHYCMGIGFNGTSNITLLGDSWLESFYTVFDKSHSLIGFAPVHTHKCVEGASDVPPSDGYLSFGGHVFSLAHMLTLGVVIVLAISRAAFLQNAK